MTIIHSSDLGWKAGQDISQEFAALAKTFKAGDTFVFDHMYKISGNDINLPNNFTLAGGAPGAGINITDSATNRHSLIELGSNNTLQDLTVTHSNVPSNDYVNKISIAANGKDNIKVLNSHFEGNVGIFLDIRYSDDLLVQDTEFNGGYYQMRVTSVDNMTVENTLFQNSFGDGIKTASSETEHPVQNATISNSVFLNNGRDGLDTTGGFRDSIVKDSYFIGNGVAGIDLKTTYDSPGDMLNTVKNANILITGSEFVNSTSAVIVTTNDRGDPPYLNKNNAADRASQNIVLENSIIENTGSTNKKMLHVKDSYDVHWNDVTLLGRLHEVRIEDRYNLNLPDDISGTNVSTGPARTSINDAFYENLAGPDWSSLSYPADGTPNTTDTDPIITPDPISYDPTPEPEAEPTPEPEVVVNAPSTTNVTVEPTQDTPTVNTVSKFLDIFLAYTDSDKNLVRLSDGKSVDGSLVDGQNLTIYALSQSDAPEIGSVKISVPGLGNRLENVEPFALFGDNGKGDFLNGKKLSDGTYSVTMTAFEGANGNGAVIETVTFDFTVTDAAGTATGTTSNPDPVVVIPEPEPEPETDLARDAAPLGDDSDLLNISLVDTQTDTHIAGLYDGMKLSSDDLANRELSISAEALDGITGIGSVRLELDGAYSRLENAAPYALFGDNGKGNFLEGKTLSDGMHTATLTAYSGKKGKGSVLEEITIEFEVGDYDSVVIDGTSSVISSYSKSQDTGTAEVSNDQSGITLESSSWKSLTLFKNITEMTVMEFEYESTTEGEIQGVGFSNGKGQLGSTFFQLGGTQELGIQDFNDYETGTGSNTYVIPVGEFFTGDFDELVLINDDDAGLGSSSTFDNISFYEAVA